MKYALGEVRPRTDGDRYWIAPTAAVMGDVTLGRDASVWWHTVIRGDNDPVVIGAGTNIQDGCVLHSDPGYPLTLGENVTIGHMVMLHGCTVGDGALVGIGSIVLNGAVIGRDSLVGANTLVTEGKEFPARSMIVGSPGRVVRELTDDDVAGIARIAPHYVENWQRFARELTPDD